MEFKDVLRRVYEACDSIGNIKATILYDIKVNFFAIFKS